MDRVLPFVKLLPETAEPPAELLGGNSLRWQGLPAPPATPVEVSYRAQVSIWGRLPLGSGGLARLHYGDGGSNVFSLPAGTVNVEPDPNAASRPCEPEVGKTASPVKVPLGDPVEIRLDFGAVCPRESNVVDVMLVLDVSGSMTGQKIEDSRAAARTFLQVVNGVPIQAGVVTFNHQIAERRGLSLDLAPAFAIVGRMTAGGGTDIAGALEAARQELWLRRPLATGVVLLMTDGWSDEAAFLTAADEIKQAGNLVVTVCFGAQCSPGLSQAATAPSFHYVAVTAADLISLYAALGAQLRQRQVAELRITDELPPHMEYVVGSAVPAPAEVRDGRTLVWRLDRPRPGASAVRYLAEPLLLGEQPTNVRAVADYVDDSGLAGAVDFPVPRVETFIPGPSGPCDPALDKVADPTRVELGSAVGVTLSLQVDCPQRHVLADVVLIIDHSASMGALDRLVNAKAAATVFLDNLLPSGMRVGLVAFSTDVNGRVPLGSDFDRLRAAVAALRPEGMTAISRALDASREILVDRRPEAVGVVVLLTDGHISVGSVADMLAAADRLKGDGAKVFTVCAGECDEELPFVASQPEYHFDVQDSARLVEVYRDLATNLTAGRAHHLVITDTFPKAIELEADSLSPVPAAGGADGAVWRFDTLPAPGLTITYRVKPLVAGRVPANRFAKLEYAYGIGQTGQAYFPAPVLEVADGPVVGPTPAVTPSTGPTPSPTARRPTTWLTWLYLPWMEPGR